MSGWCWKTADYIHVEMHGWFQKCLLVFTSRLATHDEVSGRIDSHTIFTYQNATSLCHSHPVCELRYIILSHSLFRGICCDGELAVYSAPNSCKYLKKTKYKNLDVYSPAFNPNWIERAVSVLIKIELLIIDQWDVRIRTRFKISKNCQAVECTCNLTSQK